MKIIFICVCLCCFTIIPTVLDAQEMDRPKKKIPVTFTGTSEVSATELRRAAKEELLKFKTSQRESDLYDASYNMLKYLRNNGYYFAHVDYQFLPQRNDPSSVLFTVSEHKQVTIENFSVSGAKSWHKWHEEGVHNTIGSPIKGLFKHFGVGDLIFRQVDVDNALNTIATSYILNGYQEVKVRLQPLTWNEEKNKVSIHIKVNEGPKYIFRDIAFTKNLQESNVSKKELNKIISDALISGEPFHPRYLQSQASLIRRKLFLRGYLAAKVTATYQFQSEQQVDAKIDITPGPQYIFNDLIISGNQHTRLGVFEFYTHLLHKGTPLYYGQIERSMSFLYKMGVFKQVTWDKIV
ncbi:MAG: hypothetical protein HRU15_11330, partial [Planctomycetes bacterium]|nr:hypothetical protein [Planctomycetota bacterium]